MPQKTADGARALRLALLRGRGLILAAALFSAAVNLLMLTGPVYMLQVYDRVLTSRSEATLAALSLLMGCLYLFMAVLDHARARVMARVGARLQALLDARVLHAMLVHQLAAPGDPAAQSATRDIEALQRFLASPLPIALFDIPWSPVFAAAIFVFHPWLGWLALAGAAALIGIAGLNQLLTFAAAGRAGAAALTAERQAAEIRAEAGAIRGLGMEAAAAGRWLRSRRAALSAQVALSDRMAGFAALSRGARLFLQSAMLGLGALVVLRGQMSGGAMIAGSVLLGRALQPVEVAVAQWGTFLQAREGWRRLAALMSRVPVETAPMALPRPAAEIAVEALTVTPPGESRPALRQASFTLAPGQALAVIGPSGSGKSTLARALAGIWPAQSGAIRLGGAGIGQYPPDQLGALIGYLPQRVALFEGTVAENIARLQPGAAPEEIIVAARRAGLHEAILALPEGYDTLTGPAGDPFSGGQIQQVGLARALFGDPVLLVLDEPNSNLDRAGALALNLAIREAKARGAAVVVMTHRTAAIETCDAVLLLEAGRVRGIGPREQMMRAMMRASPAAPDPAPLFRPAPRPGAAAGGRG
ncbi:type I secretion system permease/ATPase [Solirhodobacter olei]|uniref:type I secretion system permease/ATPase n=1 Tax=Solirhodobacter olei TaxID=2493082 RepID=UPI0019D4849E|nr:type I secretion system permease/ATPase [Solirhodobacter olei]